MADVEISLMTCAIIIGEKKSFGSVEFFGEKLGQELFIQILYCLRFCRNIWDNQPSPNISEVERNAITNDAIGTNCLRLH